MKKSLYPNSMIHVAIVATSRRHQGRHRIVTAGVNERVGTGSRHAEMDALIHLKARLRGRPRKKEKYVLIVVRTNRSGAFNLSYPCTLCAQWVRTHSDMLCAIWWSTPDGTIARQRLGTDFPPLSSTHCCRRVRAKDAWRESQD